MMTPKRVELDEKTGEWFVMVWGNKIPLDIQVVLEVIKKGGYILPKT